MRTTSHDTDTSDTSDSERDTHIDESESEDEHTMSRTPSNKSSSVKRRGATAARSPSASEEQPYVYVRRSPVFLLVGFAVSATIVLVCLYHFLSIRWTASRVREAARVENVSAQHLRFNSVTQHAWHSYAEHRGNVTQAILDVIGEKEKPSQREEDAQWRAISDRGTGGIQSSMESHFLSTPRLRLHSLQACAS